jgi:uncharacterized protein YqeY
MTLHEQIKGEVKNAMKEKNQVKLTAVRGLLAAFTNELVAKKKKPDELLTDEEVLAVIKRAANQRKDSIGQFKAGGRPELAEAEEAELAYLEVYLPKLMSKEALQPIVANKIKELNIADKSKLGQLIGALAKDLKGQADGADIKAVAEELLK